MQHETDASRRRLLKSGAALVVTGLGATFASRRADAAPEMTPHEKELYAAAQKEGELTWYTAHSDDITAQALGHDFEALYPGLKVNVVRTTAQVAFQRVSQEIKAGAMQVDVLSSTDIGHYVYLKDKGLLEKYVPENSTKVLDLYKNYDPDGFYYVTSAGLIAIGYNTAKLKEADAPKNWTDLLDPKWKDKIALGHPGFSGYVGTWTVSMRKLYGWQFFEKLANNNPQVGRSINDTVTMLNAGERIVAGTGPVGTAMESAQKGNPLAMIYPSEGSVLILAPSGIMKGVKHPNSAQLFMEYLMSVEASKIWVEHFNESMRAEVSAVKGATAAKDIKTVRPTVEEITTGIPEVIKQWRDTFGVSDGGEQHPGGSMSGTDTLARPVRRVKLARRLSLLEPSMALWLLLIAVLVFLVASPVVRLVISSFQQADSGGFTLSNYRDAYGSLRHWEALFHSLELGTGVAVMAGVFGVPIAWAISRTDMPAKGFVRLMVLGAFITPPYLGAIGWILLAGPNAGWLNKVWMGLTGAEHGLFNIYSMAGLILVVSVSSFPYVFVFTNSALDLVSSEMEDAANILGAGTLRTTFTITLPLVFPAIIGGLIISFLEAIALFGAPALIALPARFHVVSTQLWQFFEYPVRVEEASAFALPLLIITVLMFWLQRAVLGRKGYTAVTGKGGERRMIRLKHWRWPMLGYALFVCSLSVFLPMTVLLQAAFAKAWGRGFSLDNLTLANFRYLLFEQTQAKETILNTFVYSGATAFAAIALAFAIAYVVTRRLVPWSGLLAFLCMAPFVIPGIVLAIGFYAAYAPPPLALYGTGTILVLAFTTRFLPIAYANASSGMRSINPEMEEAVRILGGGRLLAVRKVVAPLLKKALAGAWILVFIPATRELSSAIFLVGPHSRVISVMLFDLSEEGNFEVLAALGVILLVITIAIAAIGFRVIGRDFMLRRS